jgi:hypothetical protein
MDLNAEIGLLLVAAIITFLILQLVAISLLNKHKKLIKINWIAAFRLAFHLIRFFSSL